jgi:hypothetical protein
MRESKARLEEALSTAVFDLPWTTLEGRGSFPRVRAPSFVLLLPGLFARFVLVAVLAAGVAVGLPREARAEASDAPRERAEAIFREAEKADDSLDLGRALLLYDEARALDPGSPRAPRAEARAAMLRTHAEGALVPYAMLERVRRDPALSASPSAIDELVHAAESFPSGPVRVEVWVLGAEAYGYRFGRPREAEALLRRVVGDPSAERVLAQKAARDLTTLSLSRGDLAGAEDAVRLAGTRADPKLARDVKRAVRRRSLQSASIAVVVAMLLLAARAVAARRSRERVRRALASTWKLVLGYAAYVALGGALLASGYQADTAKPFLWFGAVLAPILLLSRAWGAAGGETRAARGGRATLCAMAAVGAAFLVLEVIDVKLLEGFGL